MSNKNQDDLQEDIMCVTVSYLYAGCQLKINFSQPSAKLPVRSQHGQQILLPWGRRVQQSGELPLGGWVKLAAIRAGEWDAYFPVAVEIPAQAFFDYDGAGHARWFSLTAGQCLQGVVARYQQERRLYIVTIEPTQPGNYFLRWPRIMVNGTYD